MSDAPLSRFAELQDRVAFVTGAASGLGRQIAQTLAGAGAVVALADRNESGVQEAAAAVAGQGRNSIGLALDVTQPDSARAAVAAVIQKFGRLDICVNAAGVAGGQSEDDDAIAIWKHVIDVDLSGVYYCCLACFDVMRQQRRGVIINIASMSAQIVNHFPQPPVADSRVAGLPSYCAAKAGVRQLTRVLAAQWAPHNIRVNSISPGYMATEMTREILQMPEVVQHIEQRTPLRRVGRPQDLDGLVLLLASDSSAFVTGSDLLIDGGYSIW